MAYFSRKGYILVAKTLRDEHTLNKAGRLAACRALAAMFEKDNSAFDRKTFMAVANAQIEDDPVTAMFPDVGGGQKG